MNQITNIEEAHNTREVEEIKTALLKEMKGKHTPQFTFRDSLVEWAVTETVKKLNKDFHHQLQKAREEERERILQGLSTVSFNGTVGYIPDDVRNRIAELDKDITSTTKETDGFAEEVFKLKKFEFDEPHHQ